ncbi:hypothetical protein LTR66_010233 [Elasticomyces elasticus]|nr:hypothetical protein LTR66_010233 [Elasticomyces elasticus]
MIAEKTGEKLNATITSTVTTFVQSTVLPDAHAPSPASTSFLGGAFNMKNLTNFGGVFSYLTSRWAFATFIAALVLNRTQFYASSRTPLILKWHVRLLLYSTPILLFMWQLHNILQAMRCQTSPEFAFLRYGDPAKRFDIDFASEGGFLYRLSSMLLYWKTDVECCAATQMVPPSGENLDLVGSLSFLWPMFITLCFSQFIETLSCTLQGRQPMPETGMTVFEHSIAFAECEGMISTALGLGLFGMGKSNDHPIHEKGLVTEETANSGEFVLITRRMLLRRLNAPPELLLISLITCLSHISSGVLAITGLRSRVRLVNTGVWALCYMGAFVWSFARVIMDPLGATNSLTVMRFPTVCIIGFIPHVLCIIGICVCTIIYAIAFVFTALSIPNDVSQPLPLRDRFTLAYRNLQANVQFSSTTSIRINWSEDFYSTLMKIGFNVLGAASEAVYLNEGSSVRVPRQTWLEEKRLDELLDRSETAPENNTTLPQGLNSEHVARGLAYVDSEGNRKSGYSRERKSKKGAAVQSESGLGIASRRGRMALSLDFSRGIFWLTLSLWAQVILHLLHLCGIQRRPLWLVKASGRGGGAKVTTGQTSNRIKQKPLDFWMLSRDGNLHLPNDLNVDVEVETRRKLRDSGANIDEEVVENTLYSWWKSGGWWGEVDNSGEFLGQDDEDDLTSIISSSDADGSETGSRSGDSGPPTPTKDDPYPEWSASTGAFDTARMARLLDPKTAEEREEARILSQHLRADRPMTRSRYRKGITRERTQLLTSASSSDALGTQEEEEQAIEQFILRKRAEKNKAGAEPSWATGAEVESKNYIGLAVWLPEHVR